MPVRAAAVASAAVTVVLPTPPLPATITTREAAQKRSRSMADGCYGSPPRRSGRRRAVRRVSAVAVDRGRVASGAASSARVPARPRAGQRGIDVVQVEGYLDPPNVSLMLDAIERGELRTGRTLLDLAGEVAAARSTSTSKRWCADHEPSQVPVIVWVGPSGADAKGAATILLQAAHLAFVSPDSGAGPGQPGAARRPGRERRAGRSPTELATLAQRERPRPRRRAQRLATERLGSREAATPRRDQRRAPDHRRAHRAARREDGHHRSGRQRRCRRRR